MARDANGVAVYCCRKKVSLGEKTVFLPIEVKARGLEPRCFLGANFVESGYRVLIGRKSVLVSLAKAQKKPFVWIDKGLAPEGLEFYRLIHRKGGLLYQLHEEGAIMQPKFENELLGARFLTHEVMHECNGYFMWGERTARRVRAGRQEFRDRIHSVGHPKFDIYRRMAKEGKSSNETYVLICTSFVLGNPKNGKKVLLERLRKAMKDRYSVFDWEAKMKFSEKMCGAMIKLVNELVDAFPATQFVLRPHPVEHWGHYEESFSDNPRVRVSQGGGFRADLNEAIAVIHHDCSTGVEATIAGKPVISYNPFDEKEHSQRIAVDISLQAQGLDEVKSLLRGILTRDSRTLEAVEETRKRALEMLGDYIASVNSDCAKKIVDIVDEGVKGLSAKVESGSRPQNFGLVESAKRWAVDRFVPGGAQRQKFPGLLPEEVCSLLKEFGHSDVKCIGFAKDVCLLERRKR